MAGINNRSEFIEYLNNKLFGTDNSFGIIKNTPIKTCIYTFKNIYMK